MVMAGSPTDFEHPRWAARCLIVVNSISIPAPPVTCNAPDVVEEESVFRAMGLPYALSSALPELFPVLDI